MDEICKACDKKEEEPSIKLAAYLLNTKSWVEETVLVLQEILKKDDSHIDANLLLSGLMSSRFMEKDWKLANARFYCIPKEVNIEESEKRIISENCE